MPEDQPLNPNDPDYYLDLAAQEQRVQEMRLFTAGFHEATAEELGTERFVARTQAFDLLGDDRAGIAAYDEPPPGIPGLPATSSSSSSSTMVVVSVIAVVLALVGLSKRR